MNKLKWLEHRSITKKEQKILKIFHESVIEVLKSKVIQTTPYGSAVVLSKAMRIAKQKMKD